MISIDNTLKMDEEDDNILKNMNHEQVVEYLTTEPFIKPVIKKVKKIAVTKICKICKLDKYIDQFTDKEVSRIQICLNCRKDKAKKYYDDHAKEIIISNKVKTDNNKKKFMVYLKFNTISELTTQYNELKLKMENDLLDEIQTRKNYVYKKNIV